MIRASKVETGGVMGLDLEEIVAVVEALASVEFTDLRYEKGDLRIAIRRGGFLPDGGDAHGVTTPTEQSQKNDGQPIARPRRSPEVQKPSESPPPRSSASHARADAALANGEILITAPVLGTFYRAPKPGEPPFVEVGDEVGPDSNLCVIEVMKLYNSVRAGAAGRVVAIYASDGDLVEFDQPLVALRPL